MTPTTHSASLLARLGLPTKLAIVGGVLVAAIGVTCALLFASLSTAINDTRHEREGLAYLRGVRDVQHAVQALRSATVLTTMNVDAFKPKRDAANVAVTEAVDRMQAIDARLGVAVAAGSAWTEVRKRWENVAGMTHKSAETVVADYAPLLAQLGLVVEAVRAGSRLTIDPEADTARLRDFVAVLEPMLAEEIEQARGLGTRLIARVGASGEETTRFIELYGITGVRATALGALEQSDDPKLKAQLGVAREAIAAIRARMADISSDLTTRRSRRRSTTASPGPRSVHSARSRRRPMMHSTSYSPGASRASRRIAPSSRVASWA